MPRGNANKKNWKEKRSIILQCVFLRFALLSRCCLSCVTVCAVRSRNVTLFCRYSCNLFIKVRLLRQGKTGKVIEKIENEILFKLQTTIDDRVSINCEL